MALAGLLVSGAVSTQAAFGRLFHEPVAAYGTAPWHSFAPAIETGARAPAARPRQEGSARPTRSAARAVAARSPRRDRRAPTAPASIGVTKAASNAVSVSWAPARDNVAVAGYRTYANHRPAATTADTAYTFSGLRCETSYRFGVASYDRAGNRSRPVWVVAATAACPDTQAPAQPTALVQTAATQETVSVSWAASSDNVAVAGYGVYQGSVRIATTAERAFTFSGLSCGRNVTVAVDAFDAAGNRSAQAAVVVATSRCPDRTPPSTPGAPRTEAQTETTVSVAWDAARDDIGVAAYGLFLNGTRVGETKDTRYSFSGLACGTSYTVGIDAYDAAGNHSSQTAVVVTTSRCAPPLSSVPPPRPAPQPAPDTEAPAMPRDLAVGGSTASTVTLAWGPSSEGVEGYGLYVGDVRVGATTETSFTFSGLDCGKSFSVSVDAYDGAGNRSARASLDVKTAECPDQPEDEDSEAPSVPGGLSAGGSSEDTINISWSASEDNVGVEGYGVYRDGVRVGGTDDTSFTFSGLDCGKTYKLAVEAFDAAGNRSERAETEASTGACPSRPPPSDAEPPTAPGPMQVTASTQTSVSVSWADARDNVGVIGYGVYQNGVRVGATAVTSHTFSGLTCGTSYTFGADAYDAAGHQSPQTSAVAATSACASPPPQPRPDTEPPTTPRGLLVSDATQTSASLSWEAAIDNVGVDRYGIYLDGQRIASSATTSYRFSGLTCGKEHALGVDAADAAGNRSDVATVSVTTPACSDTRPPSPPSSLRQTGATETTATIAWSESTDEVGVAGYDVYLDGTKVASPTATTHTYVDLGCGTTYEVGVVAFDAEGNRSQATSANVATSPCPPGGDDEAPTAPSGLRLAEVTATSVSVAWNPSTDNVAVTGYGLYLDGTPTGATYATSHTFTSLTCGTSYTVGVDAEDASENRSERTSVTVTTSPCPDGQAPSTPTGLTQTGRTTTSISLRWTASVDDIGVVGYAVSVNGAHVGDTTETSYTFSGLTCGTNYTLGVEAYDASGNRSRPATVLRSTSACPDTQPPSTPTGLTRTAATPTSIAVAWDASTDNVAVTGYGVYLNGTGVGSIAATTYTFSGLTCGTSYTLAVDAYDASANRSPRATISAATAACPPSGAGDLAISPSGSDSNPCTPGAPCRSFDRVYDLAQPGTEVAVTGGTYATQTIDGTKGEPGVTFTGGSGVNATLNLRADQITFEGPMQLDWRSYRDADGLRFLGNKHEWFGIWSSRNVSIVGGEVFCVAPNGYCDYDPQITEESGSRIAPANVLIDGVYFHDWRRPPGSDWHTECLQVGAGENVTIRNSTFVRCATHDIFIRSWGGINGGVHNLRNWRIENNMLYATDGGGFFTIQFVGDLNPSGCTGNVIQYNSSGQPLKIEQCGVTVRGNLAPNVPWNCAAGVTYAYNLWQDSGSANCSPTDRTVTGTRYGVESLGFVSSSDYRLLPSSPARDAGDPSSYPGSDYEGHSRPAGSSPDAGAYEVA